MDKIRFIPVRGLEENILSMDYADGSVYFATDTKRIYLDANDIYPNLHKRISSIYIEYLKNKYMKAFHDSNVKVSEMDPMKAFGFKQ